MGQWNVSVALGAGVRTNPIVGGKDIPIVVVPQVSYYGKRVFLDNLDLGFSFWESDRSAFSLVASPGYDRVFFYRSDPQNFFVSVPTDLTASQVYAKSQTMLPHRSREVTYLAGPEWTGKFFGAIEQLDVLHDISGHDHGTEIRGAMGLPLIKNAGTLTLNLGFTWKSDSIVNYYYGAPGVYEGGSAFNPFLKLGYSRALSRKWTFSALFHCERLANAIVDSPIVDHRYVETVFVGAVYQL